MIRFIAAIDSKKGLADDHGIPWDLPSDKKYFRAKTIHSVVMMGAGWYKEQIKPLPERRNIVATSNPAPLRPGFEKTTDARQFLQEYQGEGPDIWVGGGAGLFESTLDLADELYITHLTGDFNCTKFFPDFEDKFELVQKSEPQTENGISFYYTIYKRAQSVTILPC